MVSPFHKTDSSFQRRSHGCDGCRKIAPTEKFEGYCGGHLWLCNKCYKFIVTEGIRNIKSKGNKK